jgi:mono/diheme cytochrome c family protein
MPHFRPIMITWHTIYILSFLLIHGAIFAEETETHNDTLNGEIIYREGLLPNGESLKAVGQGGYRLTGKQVTCANCHRRSGFGTSEGDILSPAITGQILFNPREISHKQLSHTRQEGVGVRPAYTDATLRRAIREGIGAGGRKLDTFMPRFELTDTDLNDLIAYLKVLGVKEEHGVSDEYIELATVITPDVPINKKMAMLSVLQTYLNDFNAGTRHEKRREQYSPWHKSWHYGAYRKWRLHIWQLKGKSESWKQQLDKLYEDQPVFTLVNGIGNEWNIVHNFCEDREIPCLFPITDLPGNTMTSYYSLYFSQGMNLEAKVIASHINESIENKEKTIVQLYHQNDIRAINAVNTLMRKLENDNSVKILNYEINNYKVGNREVIEKLDQIESPYYCVFWGDLQEEKDNIIINNFLKRASRIYVSSSFSSTEINLENAVNLDSTFIVHRFVLPERHDIQMKRFNIWVRANNLSITDEQVMADAFFTMTMLTDAIKHIRNNISREYLIERIEHMVDNTLFHSVYPHLNLGPDQRFASKGGYIISYKRNNGVWHQDAEWIVPDS